MCKIEFFSSGFVFQSAHYIQLEEINTDYLTCEATAITIVGASRAQKGSLVRITGDIFFEGIVSDIQPDNETETVSVRPLLSVLDFDWFDSDYTDIAVFIADTITQAVISNSDSLQNRAVTVTNSAPGKERRISIYGRTFNLLSLVTQALTIHRIAVDCKLDMKNKTIGCEIKEITDIRTIETGLKNILSKEITLGDNYQSKNKVVMCKTATDSETGIVSILGTVPFFLHTDGTVSTSDTDRITPVFWALEELEDTDDWDKQALSRAVEILTPQKYDNEILITCRKADRIINPVSMPIGTAVNVVHDKKIYPSILTGKTFTKDTVMLTFGLVRVELTKKLIIERRNNK